MNKGFVKEITLLIFVFTSLTAFGQWSDIRFYADVMINAEDAVHRERAAETFNELFDKKLKKGKTFGLNLDDLPWISKVYNSDSTFRFITWQLKMEEDHYQHFGYVQFNNGTLIKLYDASEDMDDVEYIVTDQAEWYGVLYYNIHEFEKEGKKMYLLFGYDGYGKYDRRKIVDVFTYDARKNITFGAEVFYKDDIGSRADIKQRLLIEYSSDSNVTLNYNPGLQMIVHDHLIRRMGVMPGQGATNLSDGSLIGYRYNGSLWEYVDKIYDHKYDVAPRPKPILVKKKHDLFGKVKNK